MSGLEYLQAMGRGDLPFAPLGLLLGMEPVEVTEGRVVFTLRPAEYHYNPIGIVHGGVASTLLDSAMGCAVHSTLPAGAGYSTLQLNVNFVRPVTVETGRIRAEGTVVHVGGGTATAEGRILDEAGRLYAHGTTTCFIMRRPAPESPA
jgi:uncharacterized protein (TIGR00369 family)